MSDSLLADGLKKQFGETFEVLRKAVESFTPEEWVRGGSPFDGPARGTIHALQCAEFYTSRDPAVWGRLGKPVWQMGPEELPQPETIIPYLDEARQATDAWIDRLVAAGLSVKSDDYSSTALESIVYAMRHLQHHTGEVCAWQKQFGHPQEYWT
jgi:uncharacterized damage-inducible protein DinB